VAVIWNVWPNNMAASPFNTPFAALILTPTNLSSPRLGEGLDGGALHPAPTLVRPRIMRVAKRFMAVLVTTRIAIYND
jgi:hypothetical protein